jgi:hypothetical protein
MDFVAKHRPIYYKIIDIDKNYNDIKLVNIYKFQVFINASQ